MVNVPVLLKKISGMRHNLSRLREQQSFTIEAFKDNLDAQDIVLHNLRLAIQGAIDIGTHIISDEGWGIPGSLNEIFYILQDKGVLTSELTEKMVSAVGLRNILVHEYEKVNLDIVYDIFQNHLADLEDFILSIIKFFKL